MRFSEIFYFGRGRSSVRRGVVALVVAPVPTAVLVAVLLLLSDLLGGRAPCESGISTRLPANLASGLFILILLFGVPTWIGLRLIYRESGVAYALAGAVWGVLGTIWLNYAFRDGWSADQFPLVIAAGLLGAFTAATFWSIARDPTIEKGDQS